MTYTTEQFWADHHKGGFRDAVTNALMSLLPETVEPEPTSPGNSGTAHDEHKPPKKSK